MISFRFFSFFFFYYRNVKRVLVSLKNCFIVLYHHFSSVLTEMRNCLLKNRDVRSKDKQRTNWSITHFNLSTLTFRFIYFIFFSRDWSANINLEKNVDPRKLPCDIHVKLDRACTRTSCSSVSLLFIPRCPSFTRESQNDPSRYICSLENSSA